NTPLTAAGLQGVRFLSQHAELMAIGGWVQNLAMLWLNRFRRYRPAREIDLFRGELVEFLFRQTEVLSQQSMRCVSKPIGDAEGGKLGEIAVIEDQNEVTGFMAETLNRVAVAARKIPNVARIEIVRFRVSCRVDDRRATASLNDESPFRSRGVPVQLAHRARFQTHRHAGDALGDGQLLNRGLLARTAADDLAFGLFESEAEHRQFLFIEQRIGLVGEIRWSRLRGRLHPCRAGDGRRAEQKPSPGQIRHDASLSMNEVRVMDG